MTGGLRRLAVAKKSGRESYSRHDFLTTAHREANHAHANEHSQPSGGFGDRGGYARIVVGIRECGERCLARRIDLRKLVAESRRTEQTDLRKLIKAGPVESSAGNIKKLNADGLVVRPRSKVK